MKTILFLSLVFGCNLIANAHQTVKSSDIDNLHFGDSIHYDLVDASKISAINLTGSLWDFSNIKYLGQEKEVCFIGDMEGHVKLIGQDEILDFKDGANAADMLIEKGVSFDAIFAFTDTLAIGAMNRLRDLGKKIPEEIAIASFSGTVLSTIVYPQLTTVEPPLQQMGKVVAELIIEKIKEPLSPNRSIVLDAEIKLRASSKKEKDSKGK